MTDPQWPATLPAQKLGDRVPLGDNISRFTPDEGPDIIRRTATIPAGETEMTFALSRPQAQTLADFFTTDLMDGAKAFTGLVDALDRARRWRFLEPPVIQRSNNGLWDATCKLEVVP